MAKKHVAVSLRKPPTPDRSPSPEAKMPLSGREVDVTTRHGDRREVTVLLPIELARKLAAHCHELDRDTSAFVAETLETALGSEPAAAATRDAVTVTIAGPGWTKIRARLTELLGRLPRTPFLRPNLAG